MAQTELDKAIKRSQKRKDWVQPELLGLTQQELYEEIGADFEVILNNVIKRGELFGRAGGSIQEFIDHQDEKVRKALDRLTRDLTYTRRIKADGEERKGTIYTSFKSGVNQQIKEGIDGLEKGELESIVDVFMTTALPNQLLEMATDEAKRFKKYKDQALGYEVVRELSIQLPRITRNAVNMHLYDGKNLNTVEMRKLVALKKSLSMIKKQGYDVDLFNPDDMEAFYKYHNNRDRDGLLPTDIMNELEADNDNEITGFKSLRKLSELDLSGCKGQSGPTQVINLKEQRKYTDIFQSRILKDISLDDVNNQITENQGMYDLNELKQVVENKSINQFQSNLTTDDLDIVDQIIPTALFEKESNYEKWRFFIFAAYIDSIGTLKQEQKEVSNLAVYDLLKEKGYVDFVYEKCEYELKPKDLTKLLREVKEAIRTNLELNGYSESYLETCLKALNQGSSYLMDTINKAGIDTSLTWGTVPEEVLPVALFEQETNEERWRFFTLTTYIDCLNELNITYNPKKMNKYDKETAFNIYKEKGYVDFINENSDLAITKATLTRLMNEVDSLVRVNLDLSNYEVSAYIGTCIEKLGRGSEYLIDMVEAADIEIKDWFNDTCKAYEEYRKDCEYER